MVSFGGINHTWIWNGESGFASGQVNPQVANSWLRDTLKTWYMQDAGRGVAQRASGDSENWTNWTKHNQTQGLEFQAKKESILHRIDKQDNGLTSTSCHSQLAEDVHCVRRKGILILEFRATSPVSGKRTSW